MREARCGNSRFQKEEMRTLWLDLSVKKKPAYCKEMQAEVSNYASKADSWKARLLPYQSRKCHGSSVPAHSMHRAAGLLWPGT